MKELEKLRIYLNNIPRSIYFHTSNIKKEIDQIGIILNSYEKIQDKFNSKNLDIKKYISEFLQDIQEQTDIIATENKNIMKELKKQELDSVYEPIEGIDYLKEFEKVDIEKTFVQQLVAQENKQVQKINKKPMTKEEIQKQKVKDFKEGKYIPQSEVEKMDMMYLLDLEREQETEDSYPILM
jgi:hypothetical protein